VYVVSCFCHKDRFGITAGEYALYFGKEDCLELLVESGAQDMVNRMKSCANNDNNPDTKLFQTKCETMPSTSKRKAEHDESNKNKAQHKESPTTLPAAASSSGAESSECLTETRASWGYLSDGAKYNQGGSLVDHQGMPVMMPWEAQLMEAHAKAMHGARHAMNIGFGYCVCAV
jgi:hypothetical protein